MVNVLRRWIPVIALTGALVAVALELSGLGVPAFARGTATGDYVVATATATIAPGTFDVGNHCDDCVTSVNLPFSYTLYDLAPFTTANVSSNGTLQFASNSQLEVNSCLPTGLLNSVILPYWDDLKTDASAGSGAGIFTSINGVAPNRIFNIEWRASPFGQTPATPNTNFEIRLYEGQAKFDVVYGSLFDGGQSATVGVQRDTGSHFTQFECNAGAPVLTANERLVFTLPPTAVTVARFVAAAAGNRVLVRWRTTSEAGVLGFNVWRASGQSLRQLNANLILAKGTLDGGASYTLVDRQANRGWNDYRLERVNLDGTRAWAGLTSARR